MTANTIIANDIILPDSARIEEGASLGQRVFLAGNGIVVRANARLDAACVIGEDVTIGRGAWVRAGSVVLRSVPPNAIVEGNPARVVGYRSVLEEYQWPEARHINVHEFAHLERPMRVALGVGESAIFLMRRITDARGALTVGEVPTEVPFSPARYFSRRRGTSRSLTSHRSSCVASMRIRSYAGIWVTS